MTLPTRFAKLAVLAVVGCLGSSNLAPAQFLGGFAGARGPALYPIPFNSPLRFNYGYSMSASIGTAIGPSINYSMSFRGPVGYAMQRAMFQPHYSGYDPLSVRVYSGYMTGGALNPTAEAARRDLERAQRAAAHQANPAPARMAIFDQWAYEKLGVSGLPALMPGQEMPEALTKALAAAREPNVATGESLNHILVAVVAAEGKGVKGDAAYLPPDLLSEIQFTGSDKAEAINLIRRAGKLNVPSAFDAPALSATKLLLEKNFAAMVAPVLIGKSADSSKVVALESVVQKARTQLDPMIKDMDFEDATAARRFLNRLDTAIGVLKKGGSASLIDPRWETEGTNIAELIKYMTKNKLLFGPVAKGNEDLYAALHRGLSAYLYVLNENKKSQAKTKRS